MQSIEGIQALKVVILVNEKLISWSKKELKSFIWARFEDYNSGRASQKALRTVRLVRNESTVIYIFWDQGLYIKWHIIDSLHNGDLSAFVVGHVTLYKIKEECYLLRNCLVDVGRMLLFMVEQVFLPVGEVWSTHNADTQCTVGGEGKPKGREEFFLKFLLSCHKIWILFHILNIHKNSIRILVRSTDFRNKILNCAVVDRP